MQEMDEHDAAEIKAIKDTINQIHDLNNDKAQIITDTHYKKYLPTQHKILRALYQVWVFLLVLSVLLVVLYFNPDMIVFREVIYKAIIFIFLYSIFEVILTLILFVAKYTIPIAVTNEVKAKKVMKINQHLDTLKGTLKRGFTRAVIDQSIHAGKFDLENINASVSNYTKNNFPSIQYIKDIVNDEVLEDVVVQVKDYINKLAIEMKKHVKGNPIRIDALGAKMALEPTVVVQMLRWMLKRGNIDGLITELDQEFVPESYISGSGSIFPAETEETGENEAEIAAQAPHVQVPPEQGQQEPATLVGQSGLHSSTPAAEMVELDGSPDVPNIERIRKDVANKKKEIQAAETAFERGDIGIDQYISISNTLNADFNFLKLRLDLVEHVRDPKIACVVCHKPIEIGVATAKCPNEHVFHIECAHEYLSKYEICPWCLQKVEIHQDE